MEIKREISFDELKQEIGHSSVFSCEDEVNILTEILNRYCEPSVYVDFFDMAVSRVDRMGWSKMKPKDWLQSALFKNMSLAEISNEFGLYDNMKMYIKSIEFDLTFKYEKDANVMGVKFDKEHHIVLCNYKDTPLIHMFTCDAHDDAETWSSIDKGLKTTADFQIWYNVDEPNKGIQMQIVPCKFNEDTDEWEQDTSISMGSNLEFTYSNLQIVTEGGTLIKC
ncbi:MAG: hypothetical protein J6Y78_06130 [Paludibacteraceae bacterium]|nr:hypothetical protein [Paludibacteraceae bacterium]